MKSKTITKITGKWDCWLFQILVLKVKKLISRSDSWCILIEISMEIRPFHLPTAKIAKWPKLKIAKLLNYQFVRVRSWSKVPSFLFFFLHPSLRFLYFFDDSGLLCGGPVVYWTKKLTLNIGHFQGWPRTNSAWGRKIDSRRPLFWAQLSKRTKLLMAEPRR